MTNTTPPPTPNADFVGIRKQLYQDIILQLKLITTGTPEVQVFKHFDIWNNQIQFIEQEPAFKRPAIFIEFLPIQWQQLSRGRKQADAVVRLHIVTDTKKRTADSSPQQEDALLYLGYPDPVNAFMFRFSQPYAGRPNNTASETDHNHADLIDMIEEFTIRVQDATSVRIPASVNNIELNINPPEPEV